MVNKIKNKPKKRTIIRIPKIYKKDGRRYIRIKGKRIYLDDDISERELIKFVISKLAPRKRKRRSMVSKETEYKGPKPGMFASQATFYSDQITKAKNDLEDSKKQIQKLLSNNALPASVGNGKKRITDSEGDVYVKSKFNILGKQSQLYLPEKNADIITGNVQKFIDKAEKAEERAENAMKRLEKIKQTEKQLLENIELYKIMGEQAKEKAKKAEHEKQAVESKLHKTEHDKDELIKQKLKQEQIALEKHLINLQHEKKAADDEWLQEWKNLLIKKYKNTPAKTVNSILAEKRSKYKIKNLSNYSVKASIEALLANDQFKKEIGESVIKKIQHPIHDIEHNIEDTKKNIMLIENTLDESPVKMINLLKTLQKDTAKRPFIDSDEPKVQQATPSQTKPDDNMSEYEHYLHQIQEGNEDEAESPIPELEDPVIAEIRNISDDTTKDAEELPSPETLQTAEGKHNTDKGLSTNEINMIMRPYGKEYLGCIGSDQIKSVILPKVKAHSRICWVMNTDPSTKPGQHWIAVFIDGRPNGSHSVEYYNPLGDRGIEKAPKKFVKDIKPVIKKLNTNNYLIFKQNLIPDQSVNSSNCGYFATNFLIKRLRGKTWADASGWDRKGEAKIEAWKKTLPPFKYMSGFK